jgi:hypothetical protein
MHFASSPAKDMGHIFLTATNQSAIKRSVKASAAPRSPPRSSSRTSKMLR